VPVTLTARAVGDALARLQEHEVDAEPAVASLGWDWEGPLRIRRYDPLVYLWYQLPTKYLAPLEAKREVASALATLLEQVGADCHAALCRAPEIEEMLAVWEDDDPRAPRRLREVAADDQRVDCADPVERSRNALVYAGDVHDVADPHAASVPARGGHQPVSSKLAEAGA